jgi:hypothetical protein
MRHSQCVHLAGNVQMPQCCVIDENLRPAHFCMVCAVETIGTMAKTLGAAYIADRVRFNRCHHREGNCGHCYNGVMGYLQSIAALASFTDKSYSNRLRKLQRKIGDINGYKRCEPPQQKVKFGY